MCPTSLGNERRLPPQALRWTCDPAELGFKTTAELPDEERIIGQDRAMRALRFGLSVDQLGYNIFVSGVPGTGRSTYARTEVEQLAKTRSVPSDWCYVRNFAAAGEPIAISLPAGQARTFRKDMAELVAEVREGLRRALASEAYEKQRAEVARKYEQAMGEIWGALEQEARKKGLAIQRTPTGVVSMPVDLQGNPVPEETFRQLPEAERNRLQGAMREVGEAVTEMLRKIRGLEREGREALRDLERQVAQFMIDQPAARLREQYTQNPKIVSFIKTVEQDMLEHAGELVGDREEEGAGPRLELPFPRRDPAVRYEVNVLVDHADTTGAPVVVETNPTYYNLIGKAEYRAEFGALVTDLTMIKPGALHRANGGYLIVAARDLLTNPFAYEGLKRALRGREIRIEPLGESLGLIPTATQRPEPIPLDVKVVLIGTPDVYHLLYALDEEFEKLFKIRADFDVVIDRTPESQRKYAQGIAAIRRKSCTCDFDAPAVAAILEHSARLAGRQDKLSTRFNEVNEIVFEASAWAAQQGRKVVNREDVRRAIEEKVLRSNLIEEKIREMIAKGLLLIDTEGQVPGQINGLSVLQLGDYSFGQPSRITARAFVGGRGVVNIERETQMSGRIHSKGVFVLASFLASRFAQQHPLSLSASLTFEQTYSDVEGDSASSTELYALLSELAVAPIEQGIATTGSVNQRGELQPIGGVNEKIEGFYYVCKARGLNGRQGVIIPHQNVRDLMLRDEVVEAVRAGRFHVWAVRTVDEGIEILTGVPAGAPQDGGFPEGTINGKVAARLNDLAKRFREFGAADGERKTPPGDLPPSPSPS